MTSLQEIARLNLAASQHKQATYIDPATGYRVFSTYGLQRRRDCCGCGCRHCPFGHELVSKDRRQGLLQDPWVEGLDGTTECDLLFWSGGKDSYLALLTLKEEACRPIVLLNTFDGRSEKVAHQEVSVEQIRKQVVALNIPVLLIPLYPQFSYLERIAHGLSLLQQQTTIKRLVFGDLHLEHIRQWREQAFATMTEQYELDLYFPLWQKNYALLLQQLTNSPVTCQISAIADEACAEQIAIGDVFDAQLMQKLPAAADGFGENGEFHTYVSF